MGKVQDAINRARNESRRNFGRRAVDGTGKQRDPAERSNRRANDLVVSRFLPNHIVDLDNDRLLEQRVIAATDRDVRVEPYRQLRTQILKTMRDNEWSTLAITSARERAGKTLTASNLSIALSMDVRTSVLLVDLDLNTPTVHEKLNLSPNKGLVDYLRGDTRLEEILFSPGLNSLAVLVGRASEKQASELLDSPKMHALMNDLCRHNEATVTIFDLPPVLRNDDAILFAPQVDATLFVVEDGVTTEDELQESMRMLQKANVVGTVFNKAKS